MRLVSDVVWLLGRLLGTVAGLKRMIKSLKLRFAKVAVGPSAAAEQLAGSECQGQGSAIHLPGFDLSGVPLCSRCERERQVDVVQ